MIQEFNAHNIDRSLEDLWVKKYHNGYLVIGWASLTDEYMLFDGNIVLRFGIEPNGIKEAVN